MRLFFLVLGIAIFGFNAVPVSAQCYMVNYEDCEDFVDEGDACNDQPCEEGWNYGDDYYCPDPSVGVTVWLANFQYPNDIAGTSDPNLGRDDWISNQTSFVYCAFIYDCDTTALCLEADGFLCQNLFRTNEIKMSDIVLTGNICDSQGPL